MWLTRKEVTIIGSSQCAEKDYILLLYQSDRLKRALIAIVCTNAVLRKSSHLARRGAHIISNPVNHCTFAR